MLGATLNRKFSAIGDATIFVVSPPPCKAWDHWRLQSSICRIAADAATTIWRK